MAGYRLDICTQCGGIIALKYANRDMHEYPCRCSNGQAATLIQENANLRVEVYRLRDELDYHINNGAEAITQCITYQERIKRLENALTWIIDRPSDEAHEIAKQALDNL